MALKSMVLSLQISEQLSFLTLIWTDLISFDNMGQDSSATSHRTGASEKFVLRENIILQHTWVVFALL